MAEQYNYSDCRCQFNIVSLDTLHLTVTFFEKRKTNTKANH